MNRGCRLLGTTVGADTLLVGSYKRKRQARKRVCTSAKNKAIL